MTRPAQPYVIGQAEWNGEVADQVEQNFEALFHTDDTLLIEEGGTSADNAKDAFTNIAAPSVAMRVAVRF